VAVVTAALPAAGLVARSSAAALAHHLMAVAALAAAVAVGVAAAMAALPVAELAERWPAVAVDLRHAVAVAAEASLRLAESSVRALSAAAQPAAVQ
jgi:hypothetical protein